MAAIERTTGKPQRQNGGRRAGAATVVTRKTANEIANSPEAPLLVMRDNMLFWHRHAKQLEEKLSAVIIDLEKPDPDLVKDAMKTLGGLIEARAQSQKCAVDLAPYVHPRLQSIAFTGGLDAKVTVISTGMTAKEAADAYASTLQGPA